VLAGVPRALPALTRAAKLGRRAARVGFDWPDARAVRAKVLEELHEVDDALTSARQPAGRAPGSPELAGELGDLLFTIVNWSRHLHIDAEAALRAANDKFERRFAHMESLAQDRGLELAQLSAAEWEGLWSEAKLNAG
jgi:ATP diphosphatase